MAEQSSPWQRFAEKSIAGEALSRAEARQVLRAGPEEVPALLEAAFRVRRRFHGLKVQIHVLENAKMGGCSEDCGFCSQSARFETGVPSRRHLSVEELLAGARAAKASQAWRYCMVTATRGPNEADLETVCRAARKIKAEMDISLCASLGFLTKDKARRLAEAGIDRFNHNLETSERHFGSVVTTHTYADRVATVRLAKEAGMETCCGGIVGLGESEEDLIDLAFALRELEADSVPVNFHDARPGTPLGAAGAPNPLFALKVLALFRFLHPRADLRAAGGREAVLRQLQPLALYAANSIFSQGYLTTPGAAASEDHQMIKDLGFEIEVAGVEAADGQVGVAADGPGSLGPQSAQARR